MNDIGVWTLINHLSTRLPFSKDKIESAFDCVLARRGENEYFTFYEGSDLPLSRDVAIETLDLRIRNDQPHPGFLVLKLYGACVSRSQVFGRYKNLTLTDFPRGRSLDEEASYTRVESWGELSFGFAERAPDCLRTVVFNPN